MKPSKPILIFGGIALAAGAIWYIKRSEKPQEEFIPVQGPKTYYGSQEASGSFFNPMGGGGAPSAGAPGVTTSPELEHNNICKEQNLPPNCQPRNTPTRVCPEGKSGVGIS